MKNLIKHKGISLRTTIKCQVLLNKIIKENLGVLFSKFQKSELKFEKKKNYQQSKILKSTFPHYMAQGTIIY